MPSVILVVCADGENDETKTPTTGLIDDNDCSCNDGDDNIVRTATMVAAATAADTGKA